MATKLRSGPCSAQRLTVRPPPPPALPTGGCQGVDLPRSVHGDKTNKQAAPVAPLLLLLNAGPAFRLARKGFPHGRPRQSPAGP